MKTKTLAKALHTITAVVCVARYLVETDDYTFGDCEPLELTMQALYVLGYTESEARANHELLAACVAKVGAL